jgi:hypothetical protein
MRLTTDGLGGQHPKSSARPFSARELAPSSQGSRPSRKVVVGPGFEPTLEASYVFAGFSFFRAYEYIVSGFRRHFGRSGR